MIQLTDVSKFYNDQSIAVNNVSLRIESGETLVLLGSSGCGKTTLLKMINRLIEPSQGKIFFDKKNILDMSPIALRRSIGYVFQGIGLFPHLTIENNIAIVLKLMGKDKKTRLKRAHELLELVELNPAEFAKRYPDELSGGQQQRVGVARALAANPHCLLMDEPFGALDAITRNSLQEEILHLNSKLKKTIIFVTHDVNEAFRLADRIAIMDKGEIIQVDTKDILRQQPKTDFVRELLQEN